MLASPNEHIGFLTLVKKYDDLKRSVRFEIAIAAQRPLLGETCRAEPMWPDGVRVIKNFFGFTLGIKCLQNTAVQSVSIDLSVGVC